MCLPPDVSTPAVLPIGRRRDVNAAAWANGKHVNDNLGAPHHHTGSIWPSSWAEIFSLASQQQGLAKGDVPAANAVDAPLCSLLASALAQQEVPQKAWLPQPNWATQTSNSFFCASPIAQTSFGCGMDSVPTLLSKSSLAGSAMGIHEPQASCTAPQVVETLDGHKEEDKSHTSSWAEDFMQECRTEQDSGAEKVCGSKLARTGSQRAKQTGRSGVKKESTSPKDAPMAHNYAGSDIEISDDEGEGAPVISEKRRKRMLSNRASAQRSRQRRQERLDTLEVLVAQLRVENAALTRKANNAVVAAKRFEEENKVLRERLESKDGRSGHDGHSRSESEDNSHSLQTTPDTSKVGSSSVEAKEAMTTSQSDQNESSENCDPNSQERDHSFHRAPLAAARCKRSIEHSRTPSPSPSHSLSPSLNFDSAFNSAVRADSDSDPIDIDIAVKVGCKSAKENIVQRIPSTSNPDYPSDYGVMKGLCVNIPQTPGFPELEPFDIDLEHSPEIDKKLLESVEEIWLESFADCFK